MTVVASLREQAIIDGHDNGPFDIELFLPTFPSTMLITQIGFGAVADFVNSYPNDFDIRNITVGSDGFGSSDLWAPTFTTTIIPPFDSYVGTPGDLTVSGGVITVNNAGDPAYGLHALSVSAREIWVQYDVFMRPAMFSSGTFSQLFHGLVAQDASIFSGIGIENIPGPLQNGWVDTTGSFFFSGLSEPGAPTVNTWMTVQFYSQIIGGDNGITFDGMPTHKAAA